MGRALGVSMSNADIDAGTIKGAAIDNCVIGANTSVAGTFTNLTSTGNTALGDATTDTIGLYGVTPIAQRAGSAQAAVDTTAATSTSPYGFSSSQANAIVTLVNELRAWAVAIGGIKGSA